MKALNRDVFRRITKYAHENELTIEIRRVGADTAARILRNIVDEEHHFKQIYEAERQYVVTRDF